MSTFTTVEFPFPHASPASEEWQKKLDDDMHSAVKLGDEHTVRHLINRGAKLNFGKNIYGPLHIASQYNHLPLVHLLLEAKANIDTPFYGMRPIYLAKGKVLKYLLNKNAVIRFRDIQNRVGRGDYKSLNIILSKRVIDLNAKDSSSGRTLLHAIADSETQIPYFNKTLALLVRYKINLDVRDESGAASLHYALLKHNLSVAIPLMERTDQWPKDRLGLTPPDWSLFDRNPRHIIIGKIAVAKLEIRHSIFKLSMRFTMTALRAAVCFFRCRNFYGRCRNLGKTRDEGKDVTK